MEGAFRFIPAAAALGTPCEVEEGGVYACDDCEDAEKKGWADGDDAAEERDATCCCCC